MARRVEDQGSPMSAALLPGALQEQRGGIAVEAST